MSLRLQPVPVATRSHAADGLLVFDEGTLVAVLARLSDLHGAEEGGWFLEAGFGRVGHPRPPTFSDIEAAQRWITRQLAGTLGQI